MKKTKLLVAPNSMKGSLSALDFANAIGEGVKEAGASEIVKIPLADGGDGTATVLAAYYDARYVSCEVHDPLMRIIDSGYFIAGDIAIIEMAMASGLKLLSPGEYSPMKATSFGTGELICQAVKNGAKEIILCVGGSATVDAGMGALMALGIKFFNGREFLQTADGENMANVVSIDSSEAVGFLDGIELKILCDVKNPLLGPKGAAKVFAPQKGADGQIVNRLSKNLSLWAGVLCQETGIDVSLMESGGAAGGIVASFSALFNAVLIDGASFLLDKTGFYEKAKWADFIITGEGKIDKSTLHGKLPGAVLNFGMKIDKPVIGICGFNALTGNAGFYRIFSLTDNVREIENTMSYAYEKVLSLVRKEIGKELYE
jgi:glycerate kinase